MSRDRDVPPYKPKYPFHIYKMRFLCDFVSGEPTPNIEISDMEFCELPEISESRTLQSDIELMFEHHTDPSSAVFVD
ncbi:hypothetical protein TUMSATVNIG1_59240 (plasmid) [Vibrio nigripulchritudo]|nr:hypothetical protein VNTUMSATTG_58760 [Vibrio nigripulchritudo]BDU35315.1 hypothetical protein TUMSATVNIG1_59240 [Vibrio nigripulchritudo]